MQVSKKTLKVTTIVLVLALIGTLVYASVVVTKQFNNTAFILTAYGLELYADENCTIPFPTIVDWGDFGASSKTKDLYIKSISNDQIWITWKLNGTNWIYNDTGLLMGVEGGYTDGWFVFRSNYAGYWFEPEDDPTHQSQYYHSILIGIDQVVKVSLCLGTPEALAHNTSFTVFISGHDTNPYP